MGTLGYNSNLYFKKCQSVALLRQSLSMQFSLIYSFIPITWGPVAINVEM